MGAKFVHTLAWFWRGSLAEAETDARDAMHAIAMTQGDIIRSVVAAHLADALMEQGRLQEATAALDWPVPSNPYPPPAGSTFS